MVRSLKGDKMINVNTSKVIICSNAANLTAALAAYTSTATVEAEYGDTTVQGTMVTMAHHGKNAGNKCPCAYENFSYAQPLEAVGVSHIDLDTLGGIMALMGIKPEAPGFWALAEYVDLNGPHKVSQSGASASDMSKLYAWMAYSKKNTLRAEKDGSITDVTEPVTKMVGVLTLIINDDPGLMAEGTAFLGEEKDLNIRSFIEVVGGVILRVSRDREFVNALYNPPSASAPALAVVALKIGGGVTLSFADSIDGVSANDLVKEVWGPNAGGHAGIAGNPRGQTATMAEALCLRDLAVKSLKTESTV